MRNRPLYAYDAEADTVQRWHVVSSQVAEELRTGNISPLFNVEASKATDVIAPVANASSVT